MINFETVKYAFVRRLGDMEIAENKYFDLYHRALNIDEYIKAALEDCRGYFGVSNIPRVVSAAAVADIAYIRFQLDTAYGQRTYGLKSTSYSEGTISKSETYSTEQEISGFIENILKPYRRFRVVSGYGKFENT